MSVNKLFLVLVVMLSLATSAFAASKSRELSVDGNYYAADGQSATLLRASIGQFVSPQLVVVTGITLQRNFVATATTIAIGGKYYFMDGFKGDLVPFAGIGLGLRTQASKTDPNVSIASTQYAINGGLAYFMSDSTTLDVKLELQIYNDASPSATYISAGFSQRF